MPVLDFKEIPEAHVADGRQDTFELFARDVLSFIGFTVVAAPDRGADGGKDLIVEERRTGVGGETVLRWLVSCKHKAFSGKSVSPADDSNIQDRVAANKCQGFLGFYSTLPSAGLGGILAGLNIETQVFDRERIEGELLHSAKGLEIAERYFPESLAVWKTENPSPAKIFADQSSLRCHVCDKELLEQDDKGIVTLWQEMKDGDYSRPDSYHHVFWTCRGHCDRVLKDRMRDERLIDGWEDISDVMMPTIYVKWTMSIMNELRSGVTYSDEAFEALKEFLLQVYPYVARDLSTNERERVKTLSGIPAFLGGLGY
ncbi:hypothetical protein EU803_16690 [Loktanella sp. IMCC34160]|uniref:restriction endonuclease n=1 Tax=Loktanella sp. IMCC34160 TaxID=2510646 RepID=UPI00101DE6A7|nr:restriction endonuclease [Loktanella sp. IMCC34160]RYG89788.1 hypothetical protein EU803_16690 [Loktanella sp. IMCC34160]